MLTEVKHFAQGHSDRQDSPGRAGPDTVDVVPIWTGCVTGQITCAFCLSFYIWNTSIGTLAQTVGF